MKKTYSIITLLLSCFAISYAAPLAGSTNQIVIIKPYSIGQYNKEITKFYTTHEDSQSVNLLNRFITDSGFFLGKPYLLDALGEGPAAEFDKSPLYRTDAFDCMTYVSTVLAMVESTNLQQFRDHLLDIQYSNGFPSYLTRNHFVSVDWNINNERNGYLTDYTKKLFSKSYLIATAVINRPSWFAHLQANNLKQFHSLTPEQTSQLLNKLQALGKQTKVEVSQLPYVPLTALFYNDGKPIMQQFNKIPSGSVIEIVRPNWNLSKLIGTNMNVSHLGFAIRINNVLMYREASSMTNKVIDMPLDKYLANYLNSSTVKGINIQLINLVKQK